MKTVLITFIFTCLSYSQISLNIRAQANYYSARSNYEKGSYREAISYLLKSKKKLKGSNQRLEYLLTMSYYKQGNILKAKEALDKYFFYEENYKEEVLYKSLDRDLNEHETLILTKAIDEIYEKAEQELEKIKKSKISELKKSKIDIFVKKISELNNYLDNKHNGKVYNYEMTVKNSKKNVRFKAYLRFRYLIISRKLEVLSYINYLNYPSTDLSPVSNFPAFEILSIPLANVKKITTESINNYDSDLRLYLYTEKKIKLEKTKIINRYGKAFFKYKDHRRTGEYSDEYLAWLRAKYTKNNWVKIIDLFSPNRENLTEDSRVFKKQGHPYTNIEFGSNEIMSISGFWSGNSSSKNDFQQILENKKFQKLFNETFLNIPKAD